MATDTDIDTEPRVADETDDAAQDAPKPTERDLERSIEAILMVADEPLSLVSLATSLGAPVPAVRQSIQRLVADYDGVDGGTQRGFELREVGGGWRIYVREAYDDVVRDFVL